VEARRAEAQAPQPKKWTGVAPALARDRANRANRFRPSNRSVEPQANPRARVRKARRHPRSGRINRSAGPQANPRGKVQEGQKASPQQQNQQERGTTGQPPRQGQDTQGQGQQPRQDMQRGEGRQQPGATQDQGGTGGATAQLTTEQRTQVRQTVLQSGNVPRVSRSDVDINISVGTVVPRTVRLVTVPQKIVEIRPAWRGFRYFVVDDEIVIVEPGSLKIVAVIPA
jgi:hypothetical protein